MMLMNDDYPNFNYYLVAILIIYYNPISIIIIILFINMAVVGGDIAS